MPHPFVQLLQAKQRAANLSDAQYARDVLGVSPATWSQVQSNGRGIGKKVIHAALRAYPSDVDQLAFAKALSQPVTRATRAAELPGRIHSAGMRRGLAALSAANTAPNVSPEAAAS